MAEIGVAPIGPEKRDIVLARLQEAGRDLLSLRQTGYAPGSTTCDLSVLIRALAGNVPLPGTSPTELSRKRVTRMNEALAWLGLIPEKLPRHICATRALNDPVTAQPIYDFSDIGQHIGLSSHAVVRLHDYAIDVIAQRAARVTP